MKALHRDLHDANLLYKDEQAKVTQRSANNSRTRNTVSRRPKSPMSPMVNPLQYDPLPHTGYTDDHSTRSRVFDLDEKFDNLDLDYQVLPTQIPYPNQTPNTHTPNSKNQGDILTNNQFDTGDIVNPTPVEQEVMLDLE